MPTATIRPWLRPWVASIVGYDERMPADAVHFGAPSPTATLVLSFREPVDIGWHGEQRHRPLDALAAGLHLAPSLIRTHGVQCGVHIALTPGGVRALLGMPVAELSGRMEELDALAPRLTRCRVRMEESPSWGERFTLLQDALETMASAHRAPSTADPFALFCWDMLLDSGGWMSIAALAERTGTSRRTVSSRISREFGLPPKQIARVMRFARSQELWDRAMRMSPGDACPGTARPMTIADLAAASGYSDHAHLTREWRALGGQVPSTWEAFPILQASDGG